MTIPTPPTPSAKCPVCAAPGPPRKDETWNGIRGPGARVVAVEYVCESCGVKFDNDNAWTAQQLPVASGQEKKPPIGSVFQRMVKHIASLDAKPLPVASDPQATPETPILIGGKLLNQFTKMLDRCAITGEIQARVLGCFNKIQKNIEALERRALAAEARLSPVSPQGDDRVDELESCIGFLRAERDSLTAQLRTITTERDNARKALSLGGVKDEVRSLTAQLAAAKEALEYARDATFRVFGDTGVQKLDKIIRGITPPSFGPEKPQEKEDAEYLPPGCPSDFNED